LKFCLDFEVECTDIRPKLRERYVSDSLGNQRLLTPAGAGLWDLWILLHVPELSGRETDRQLRQICDVVPRPYIERRAPSQIRNVTYIFVVDRFTSKFVKSRSRLLGAMLHHRFWFFSSAMGESQIIARIRSLAGRIYAARAEKIVEALARKHIQPYKDLKRTVDLFRLVGERLKSIGERAIVRFRQHVRAVAPVQPTASPARHAAILTILDIARNNLPDLYQDFQVLYSMSCRGPAGPAAAAGGEALAAA
jgi:hypothetical protein